MKLKPNQTEFFKNILINFFMISILLIIIFLVFSV